MVRVASGDRMPASRVLRQPDVRLADLLGDGLVPLEIDADAAAVDIASVETSIKYAGYLRRQESEIERASRDERRRIPAGFAFERVSGLSREVVQRLSQVRPDTLGQALRIPGVTPAAVAVLGAHVGRVALTADSGSIQVLTGLEQQMSDSDELVDDGVSRAIARAG